ncbi:MAG: hypothetical protein COA78_13660 [Blastopirellula sp.]|nr:MAG: hypothetical protein COA78_13660 [Blastopirellula sp.]
MNWGDQNQTDQNSYQPNYMRAILLSVAIGLLVVLYLNRGNDTVESFEHPWQGHTISQASYQPLLGTDQSFESADFQGKVTLVNYWGPWCGYCLKEFPDLMEMRDEFSASTDFQYLAVSCGYPGQAGLPPFHEDIEELTASTQETLKHLDYDLPVHVDAQGLGRTELNAITPWSGYPTTMLVDRTGTIVQVWIGYHANSDPIRNRVAEELEKL